MGTYEQVHSADYDIESILKQYTKSMDTNEDRGDKKKFAVELVKTVSDSPTKLKKKK